MSEVAAPIEKTRSNNRSSETSESRPLMDNQPVWAENTQNLEQDSLIDQENTLIASSPTAQSAPSPSGSQNLASTPEENQEIAAEVPESTIPSVEGSPPTGQEATQEGVQEEEQQEVFYPTSPTEDPAFLAMTQASEQVAENQTQHDLPEEEVQRAQAAAPLAANERMGAAQSGQVEAMAEQEPQEFDAAGFKAALMEKIEQMQLPENPEQATRFDQHNNLSEIQESATSQVEQEQEHAAGPIQTTSEAAPNLEAVTEREVESLPEPDPGEIPQSIAANRAMPARRPDTQVTTPLQDNVSEVEQQMESQNISDEQLANANEPTFTNALASTESARQHAATAPDQFRQGERATLNQSSERAENLSQSQLQEMHTARQGTLDQLATTQQDTGLNDSAERSRIAADIDGIYQRTKAKVEEILNSLEEKVTSMFTTAATKAKELFETYVDTKMKAYKSRRYSGLDGAARWVYDKFAGIPEEVNTFFTEGRKLYIQSIDKALDPIANTVASQLNLAKTTIQEGRNEVATYVAELPANLQDIGTQAAESIQSEFDSLDESVTEKQSSLVDSLAAQYMEGLEAVDARIEEMKAENRGLIDMALDAIGGVIQVIIDLRNAFLNLLSALADVVQTILEDPIGFLKNLFGGIALGFENFGKNILTHLQAGLISWLTGSLGGVGIQLPEDIFSLKGIFSLVSQILGFTWDKVREIGVKVIGEPIMKALETGFEIILILKNEGLAGLWEYIKEQFGDLKETIIEAIKTMIRDTIIGAGIKWILGLLSPVGAFIKAAMAIVDVITFFVQKASQIIELLSAFVEGVRAVASGSVGAVAAAIENALARAIPLVIGFLANLLGIGGLAKKVTAIIKKIQARVAKAIKKLWLKIKELGKKFLKKLGLGGEKESKNDPEKQKKIDAGKVFLKEEEKRKDGNGNGKLTFEEAQKVAQETKKKHPVFKTIKPRKKGDTWLYDWTGSDGTIDTKTKVEGDRPILSEKTKVNTSGDTKATAFPVTKNQEGSPSTADTPAWDHAKKLNFAKGPDKHGVEGRKGDWIKGHKITWRMGGDGTKPSNIFIIDRSANGQMGTHEVNAGKRLKQLIDTPNEAKKEGDKVMFYEVNYSLHVIDGLVKGFGNEIKISYGTSKLDGKEKTYEAKDQKTESSDPPLSADDISYNLNRVGGGTLRDILKSHGIMPSLADDIAKVRKDGNFSDFDDLVSRMNSYSGKLNLSASSRVSQLAKLATATSSSLSIEEKS